MSQEKYIPIKHWDVEDRPREKLLKRGAAALTDAELVAILLSTGTREMSAIDLARLVLKERGGLRQLGRSSVAALTKIRGIGKAKALTLVAAFELAKRKNAVQAEEVRFTGSATVFQYLHPKLADLEQEVFYLLCLNRKNVVKAEKAIFKGGVSTTIIDYKLIFKEAFVHLASALIVAHNHPSGTLKPSKADISITQRLVKMGKLMEIPILDHLIITQDGYYSFADAGMLKSE